MILRRIEKENVRECLDIYNYYVKNTVFSLEYDEVTYGEFYNRIRKISSKYPYIVALDDDNRVLGFAYLDSFNERKGYDKTADLSIYVSKEHLNEHIGKALLNEILLMGKEMGITNVISIITSENERSKRFHQINGFVPEGTLNNIAIKFNRILSVDYYRKQL